jgi:hypothetical protein
MNTKPLERTKLLSLRLKPEEHRWLLAEAEKMYVPLSAYIRHRLFAGKTRNQSQAGRRRRQKI